MSAAVKLVKRLASKFGYDVHRRTPTPLVSPWINNESFRTHFDAIESLTLISADRCYVLYTLALQASCLHGHWYECGVYKGGSAILLSNLISENRRHEQTELHLFDTFEGMPEPNPSKDLHRQGDVRRLYSAVGDDLPPSDRRCVLGTDRIESRLCRRSHERRNSRRLCRGDRHHP